MNNKQPAPTWGLQHLVRTIRNLKMLGHIKRLFGKVEREVEWVSYDDADLEIDLYRDSDIDLYDDEMGIDLIRDVREQHVDVRQVTQIVLFILLEKNLHHFDIHDQVGRVVLASYQPHNQYDPVLPVPLINLSQEFNEAYRNLAEVLSEWIDAMFALSYDCENFNNYRGYLHRAPSKPTAVNTHAYTKSIIKYGKNALYWARKSNQWTREEWDYFQSQMLESMARPDRFLDYDDERTRAIWEKAVNYNINLSH